MRHTFAVVLFVALFFALIFSLGPLLETFECAEWKLTGAESCIGVPGLMHCEPARECVRKKVPR